MVLRDCVWLTDTHTFFFSPTHPYDHRTTDNRGNTEKKEAEKGSWLKQVRKISRVEVKKTETIGGRVKKERKEVQKT
jgi:hypothetical protein